MKDTFWNTDLDEIEAAFLPDGIKITDLPVCFDNRVPPLGGELLDRTVNIDCELRSRLQAF